MWNEPRFGYPCPKVRFSPDADDEKQIKKLCGAVVVESRAPATKLRNKIPTMRHEIGFNL